MNNLQKLLKLRGLSAKAVSDRIGHGYHNTQKVIKGSRNNLKIEAGVAALLGLTHEEAWGENSRRILLQLIRQEVKKQAELRAQKLQQQWLNGDSVQKK